MVLVKLRQKTKKQKSKLIVKNVIGNYLFSEIKNTNILEIRILKYEILNRHLVVLKIHLFGQVTSYFDAFLALLS